MKNQTYRKRSKYYFQSGHNHFSFVSCSVFIVCAALLHIILAYVNNIEYTSISVYLLSTHTYQDAHPLNGIWV